MLQRNKKHQEVQKPLLISLHADICLLRLLISLSTDYSSCSGLINPIVEIFKIGFHFSMLILKAPI